MKPGVIGVWIVLLGITGYLVYLNLRLFFPSSVQESGSAYEVEEYEPVPESLRERWSTIFGESTNLGSMEFVVEDPFGVSPDLVVSEADRKPAPPTTVHPEPPKMDEVESYRFLERLLATLPLGKPREERKPEQAQKGKRNVELQVPNAVIKVVLVGKAAKLAVTEDGIIREGDAFYGWTVWRVTEEGVWLRSMGRKVLLPLDSEEQVESIQDERQVHLDQGGS